MNMAARHRPEPPDHSEKPQRGLLPTVPRRLLAIMVLYTVLALYAAFTVGVGRPPDEGTHLAYMRFLLHERSLPLFTPDETNYEAHQPPLAYILGAAALLLGKGIPEAARLVSVLMGLLIIWATHRLAEELNPLDEPMIPLGAAAFAAFLPMHVLVLSSISNDPLNEAVFSVTCLGLVLGLRSGFTPKKAALIGLLTGIGILSKHTAVLLVPVALLAFFLDWRRRKYSGATLALNVGIALLVMLAVCGWWLWRNTVLYGDPLAARKFQEVFKALGRPGPSYFTSRGFSLATYWELVGLNTFKSFWGLFGNILQGQMPAGVYWATLAATLAAAVGLVRLPLAQKHNKVLEGWQKDACLTLLVGCALLLAMFVRFNVIFFQAQGRYLFPMISTIAIGFMVGWANVFPNRARGAAILGLTGALLLLCLTAVTKWMQEWPG